MPEEKEKGPKKKLAEERTIYAEVRTALAKKRTIQSCIRTGLALIGGGIVILKFTQIGELSLILGFGLVALGFWAVLYYSWWGKRLTNVLEKVEKEMKEKAENGETISDDSHKPEVLKKIKKPVKKPFKKMKSKKGNN